MKLWSTTPSVSRARLNQSVLVAMTVLVASAGVFHAGSAVFARNYDAEIKLKEQEAERYQSEADKLGQMADTLQGEIDRLNGQISALQGQINDSQTKYDNLITQIDKNKKLIEKNREALGDILSDIYVDDQVSPLEMLASSKSIGDYIDKQEQRTSLRQALGDKIKEIKKLQKKLEKDKKSVEAVLSDLKSQQNQLSTVQGEQQSILNKTQGDKNVYTNLVAERNSEISRLRVQQAEENLRQMQQSGWSGGGIPAPSSGNGGYPAMWANAPLDAYIDNWGLYTRECVSYVAWKVASSGRFVPHFGGRGHAYQWPSTTSAYGIPNGSTPKVGAAAVMYGGPYGHVMYVEAVHSNGTITVSDYNLGVDGLYRYYDRSADGLTYIYF